MHEEKNMKRMVLAALCLLVLSAPLFADMSKEELQRMYLDYLISRNIQAHIDEEGDIEFDYEGTHINVELTFYIVIDESDQQYFRILAPGLYSLETESKRHQALLAAANASRRASVAKIYARADGATMNASAEAFVASPQDFKVVFLKLMRELDNVMHYFLNEI